MNILVTGGAGYIGSHLVPKLLAVDHHVTVLDDFSNVIDYRSTIAIGNSLGYPKFQWYNEDICDLNRAADVLIHLAGRISVSDPSWELWDYNVGRPIRMLSQRVRAKKIIVASSAAVYGEGFTRPVREDDALNPSSVYGRTKVVLEQLADGFNDEVISLRLFNVAGGRERHRNETHILPLALTGEVQVHGPSALQMVRDYVHVEDVADAFVKAIDGPHGVYNIGTGRGTRTHELLAEVQSNRNLKVVVGPSRKGDPSYLVADAASAYRTLGWQPKHDLESIVRSAWESRIAEEAREVKPGL